jgi:hypothetical protein
MTILSNNHFILICTYLLAITFDEDGVEPSEKYLEEVYEYFQQQLPRDSLNREARQASGGKLSVNLWPYRIYLLTGAIRHGDTVAFKTYTRHHWLSCGRSYCSWSGCPRMYMAGNDWNSCGGEVFRIYRAGGHGTVRVGDLVGIYYPQQRGHWMGCSGNECRKSLCPGYPTIAHGFASQEKWYVCSGEVFKIYARGKPSGAIIDTTDDVSFYYLNRGLWVSQGYDIHTMKQPCLGTSRPPASHIYDGCAHEIFKIWKR